MTAKNQKWKLFIDDERFPTDADFHIARNSYDAIWLIENKGMPIEIAFDHDLGGQDTAMKVVHWIMNKILDGDLQLPVGFTYSVHSQNPIGAQNIRNAMEDLKRLA